MITGLYDETLFIIDNEDLGVTHVRPNNAPSNWFRNKYGLIIANTSNIHLGMYGFNLDVAIQNIGQITQPASDTAGILITEENVYLMCTMSDDITKHYSQLKKPNVKETHIPILAPITDLESQLEFTHASRVIATITENIPSEKRLTLEEYIHKTYKRSLAGRTYGEVGTLYQITVADLKTCLNLAKERKYIDIDQYWKISPLAEIEVAKVSLSELQTFSWANLEML